MHNLVHNSQRSTIGHSIDERDKTKTVDTSLVHIMSHRKFFITVTKRYFSFLKLRSRVLPRSADVRLVSRTSSDNIIRCRHRNNTTMTNQRLSSKPPSFLKPWFFSRVTDAANERYRLEEKSKDSKSRCRRASFQSAFSPRRVCLLCQRETTKYFSHLEYFFPTQCKTYFEVEDG